MLWTYLFFILLVVSIATVVTLLIRKEKKLGKEIISENQQIKESLNSQQDYLNAIINTTPACVKIVDESGLLVSINNIGLEMIEAESIEEVIGKKITDFLLPEYVIPFTQLNQNVCAGKSQSLIYEIIGLKGTRKWMETRAVPLRNSKGRTMHLALTDDITDRVRVEQELKESERLKNTILSSITDAFFALDTNWNLIYLNQQAEKLFDRSYDELIGRNFWEEFPTISISHFYKKYLKAIRNEKQIEFEYFYPVLKKWLRVKIYPSSQGFSIINTDITQEKTEQTLLELERSMLLESSKGNKRLVHIFEDAIRTIEFLFPQIYCSIHKVSDDGKRLVNFSSPHLPDMLLSAIEEIDLGDSWPQAAAANDRRSIIVQGINSQQDYPRIKEFIKETEIVTCISHPMLATNEEVLGVFTVFYRKYISQNFDEVKLIEKIRDIFREILEDKKKEEELTKISLIARNTNKAVFISNMNQEITWVNDAFTKMTGYEEEEAIGKNPFELLSGEYSEESSVNYLKEQMKENKPFTINTIFHKKNGSTYWSRITGQPMFDEIGEINQYFAIQEDTTVRKLAKMDLQDSEKRYRALFHSNPQPMFIYDKASMRFNEVNESAEKTYGYTPDEFNSMTMQDLFVKNDLALFLNNDDKINYRNNILLNSEIKYEEYTHITKEGKEINVEMVRNEILISGKETILVIINDVTNKLIIEKELRRSNERFSIASKAVSDIIWEWDIKRNTLYWGEGIYEAFGYKDEREIPMAENFSQYVHPEDYQHVKKEYEALIKNKNEKYWSAEYRFKKADETFANVLDRAYIIRNGRGEAVKVIGAMRDVTEQKNHEAEKSKLIAQTQEFERKRFSMELHDGLAQQLVVLNLYLSQFSEDEPVDAELLKNCFDIVKSSLNQTRAMCYNLTPPELENGILDALTAMFRRLKSLNSFDFEFLVPENVGNEDFDTVDVYNLYRIVQEFVNNSIKHSQGTTIRCHINKSEDNFSIEVSDNGVGFDEELINNGLGLNNIEKRAKLANVKCKMSSKIGEGTQLLISIRN